MQLSLDVKEGSVGRLSVASILLLANGNPGPTVGGGHVAIVQREKLR